MWKRIKNLWKLSAWTIEEIQGKLVINKIVSTVERKPAIIIKEEKEEKNDTASE